MNATAWLSGSSTPAPPHPIGRFVCARSRGARLARAALVALGVLLGLAALRIPIASLAPPYVYRKDFLQPYLLSRAIADGTDPYLPVSTLAARYLGSLPVAVFPHPTPHPPTLGLLLLPLAWTDYQTASAAWLATEIGLVGVSIGLIARATGFRLSIGRAVALTLAALAWHPVWSELATGQVGTLLLLLLASSLLAMRAGHSAMSGALLGVAILAKPVTWPILLLFALGRSWAALASSGAAVVLGYGLAAPIVGLDRVAGYLTQVLPVVGGYYRGHFANLSLWSVAWRVFDGTGSAFALGVTAPPVIPSALLASLASVALPGLALLLAWRAVRGRACQGSSWGVMTCVAILVSPIAWEHYLVLLLLPIAQVVRWLADHRFPRVETNRALLVATLLAPSQLDWTRLALLASGQQPLPGESATLPALPALLTFGPALGVGALAWLLASLPATRQSLQTVEPASPPAAQPGPARRPA